MRYATSEPQFERPLPSWGMKAVHPDGLIAASRPSVRKREKSPERRASDDLILSRNAGSLCFSYFYPDYDEDKHMSNGYRKSLFLLAVMASLMFGLSASAQFDCRDCDPYTNHCSDSCDKCQWFMVDGSCGSYISSVCGGQFGNHDHNCLADDCEPSWSETSRVTQGTYDGNSWNGCNHHSVQWVTLEDQNHCNTNEIYWTQNYCDNVIDGQKSGFYPDCCNGYDGNGNPDPLFTCDGNHSCTG